MRYLLLWLWLIIFLNASAFAQLACQNIGFENGNTSGWVFTSGKIADKNESIIYQNEKQETRYKEHFLTNVDNGNDVRIPALKMVAPGSKHSMRIGSIGTGPNFSRMHANYTITSDNTLFQYQFAVVLQNSISSAGIDNHKAFQKPGINIAIFDSNGNILPCSNYNVQLQGGNIVDGFRKYGEFQYRNWTTGAIDLRDYIGQTIKIVVTAHACTAGGHIGYAYFDAECLKSEIKTASPCPDEEGYLTLMAPEGFGKYTWSTGETTRNIRVKAKLGDPYFVKILPQNSLDSSCAFQLDYKVQFQTNAATIDSTICEGEQVAVGDTVYKTSGTYVRNIMHTDLCDSTVTLNLEVVPMKLSVTPDSYIKYGDSVEISVKAEPQGDYQYVWNNTGSLSCPDCVETWAKPLRTTEYTVTVTDADKICSKQESVSVHVKPCGIVIPEVFSPNDDQINDVFFVKGNTCVKQILEMSIYNRWGEMIYNQKNFQPSDPTQGWPGTYNNKPSTPGVYLYKIKVELEDGEVVDYSGKVSLVR